MVEIYHMIEPRLLVSGIALIEVGTERFRLHNQCQIVKSRVVR